MENPMIPPLTPNTSAFLSYLSNSYDPSSAKTTTAAPPSAFFNIPGNEFAGPSEDNTPSSKDASVSPPLPGDSDSDAAPAARRASMNGTGAGHTKRKVSRVHQSHEDDEDDSVSSDSPDGHEDKKHEPNAKPRKSKDGTGKELTKAQRRKEQNRAAQKAFRERREAKVHDLEEKVAELESKSYGVNVENENLRGILKRLQEENVALKQNAFTFSMPSNVTNSVPAPRQPSPQHSDELKSLNAKSVSPPAASQPSRSPQSAATTDSSSQQLFTPSNAFEQLKGPSPPILSPASSNRTEIEALWASFMDQQTQGKPAPKSPGLPLKEYSVGAAAPPIGTPSNVTGNDWDKMAFRDDSKTDKQVKDDQGIQDFLASLAGNEKDNNADPAADDDFNAQLLQLLGDSASPSAAFNFPTAFSPTNYLNIEASPLASINSVDSMSASASASPESSGTGAGTSVTSVSAAGDTMQDRKASVPAPNCGPLYVLGKDGSIVHPIDIHKRLGLEKENAAHELLVDDLCDLMKDKVTCKDGRAYLSEADAEYLIQRKSLDVDVVKGMVAPWG